MIKQMPKPDPPLTPEEKVRVAQLNDDQVRAIDEALLSNTCSNWRKVARVVGTTMMGIENLGGIPDLYYAHRVRKLVEAGRLESQGNLSCMGIGEVRFPNDSNRILET
jgi:hypothetical protein